MSMKKVPDESLIVSSI